jgi:hypothetical protein
MNFKLTGIFDDGRSLGVDVHPNTRRDINFVRGSSLIIDVAMIYNDGSPINLAAVAATGVFTMKKNSSEWLKRLRIEGVILTPAVSGEPSPIGTMRFAADPRAFTQILPGRYVYDIALTIADVRNIVVPLSHFFVQPSTIGPGTIPNP